MYEGSILFGSFGGDPTWWLKWKIAVFIFAMHISKGCKFYLVGVKKILEIIPASIFQRNVGKTCGLVIVFVIAVGAVLDNFPLSGFLAKSC